MKDEQTQTGSASDTQSRVSLPMLERLFTGRHRALHGRASFVLGLLGLAVYASVSSMIASMAFNETIEYLGNEDIVALSILVGSAAIFYVAVVFATQCFACLQLPMSIRLAMVFATNFVCWQNMAPSGEKVDGVFVLMVSFFCVSGFAKRYAGWRLVAWNQKISETRRFTISTLLDVTASIALVMAILVGQEFRLEELVARSVPICLFGLVGIHIWGRVVHLCQWPMERIVQGSYWVIGNAIGCVVLLLVYLVVFGAESILASMLVLPCLIGIVQAWTSIPITWMRACGWRVRPPCEKPTLAYASSAV